MKLSDVNLTDLLPTLSANKHDFVNENGVPKKHLGRQGSIQSDFIVWELSEVVRGCPELSGSAWKLSGAIPGRLAPPGIVQELSGTCPGRPGTLRSLPNLFPSRIWSYQATFARIYARPGKIPSAIRCRPLFFSSGNQNS